MIRKIRADQLRVGMYVHDFNAGWLEHPFARNRMKIGDDADLRKLAASGIRELFIDTERGVDVLDAPSRAESAAATDRQLLTLDGTPRAPVRVALADEMTRARSVFAEGTRAIRSVMEDARLGRQLEIEAVSPLVEKIAASVIRNSDALLSMRRLKHLDDYTYQHSVAVCTMLAGFARELGMDLPDIHSVALGGLLHDIGKARVSAALLNKAQALSDEEFIHLKSHVVLGADLLRQMPGVPPLAVAVLELHHERFDGSGYPQALAGEQIGLVGRMAAIVDVYDAITSERAYHAPISPAAAIRKLFELSGTQFDAQLVQRFVRSVGIYPVGTLVRLESGRLGIVTEQRESSLLTPVVRVIFDARRNYYIAPEEVDLSRPLGAGGGDRIVGHESPASWQIEIERFL